MKIEFFHSRGRDLTGFIPQFLNEADPRPAKEQLHENYMHGGGWQPFSGFVLDPENMSITYPDDPPYRPVAEITFREELIYIYPHAWVMIYQKSGEFEIARMD